MELLLTCSKCGKPIKISSEAVEEASKLGQPINPVHEECPDTIKAPNFVRHFKVKVEVFELHEDGELRGLAIVPGEELMASFAGEYEGDSFASTLPKLQVELNKGWEQVQKMASVIDGPAID